MNKKKKTIIIILAFLLLTGAMVGFFAYRYAFLPNIQLDDRTKIIFIPTGSDFDQLMDSLNKHVDFGNSASFLKLAEIKNLKKNVKPGRYLIRNNMSNNSLINLLRSGDQEPINLTFNNIRTKKQLVEKVGEELETDPKELLNLLNDPVWLSEKGFGRENVLCLFIPNSYQFYWNTSAKKFLSRMYDEYQKFWNDARKEKAKQIGLTPLQVSTLASIVQAEQSMKNDEKARIAGLYINRLKRNMLLQSDPTLIYAIGDFSIRRVLNKDKEVNSPYNTYKYSGLPPGPINLPEISSIEAVLNYEKNNYLFMCAKEDFSGYHNFAKTAEQHQAFARKYQQALNRRNIKR